MRRGHLRDASTQFRVDTASSVVGKDADLVELLRIANVPDPEDVAAGPSAFLEWRDSPPAGWAGNPAGDQDMDASADWSGRSRGSRKVAGGAPAVERGSVRRGRADSGELKDGASLSRTLRGSVVTHPVSPTPGPQPAGRMDRAPRPFIQPVLWGRRVPAAPTSPRPRGTPTRSQADGGQGGGPVGGDGTAGVVERDLAVADGGLQPVLDGVLVAGGLAAGAVTRLGPQVLGVTGRAAEFEGMRWSSS